MNLCIIGDSWGGNCDTIQGAVDDPLMAMGHTVLNISESGSSNYGQLQKLRYQVLQKGKTEFDYIVWMHTEPIRNFTEFVSHDYGQYDTQALAVQYPDLSFKNFYADLDYMRRRDYIATQKLYKRFGIPFLVVGSAGKLPDFINQFDFVHRAIPSWTQKILGLETNNQLPVNCYLDHVLKTIEHTKSYDKLEVLQEISRLVTLEKIMLTDKINFADKHHPSYQLYPAMLRELLSGL